jgi:hypothetical protein
MRFTLGRVVATPGALRALEASGQTPDEFVRRHSNCDFGSVCRDDKKANDEALKDGSRIISSYVLNDGETKLWLITEAEDDQGQRAATTLLLPSEY